MINKKLEADIKELQGFIDLWVSFKDQFHAACQNKETTPDAEKKFLETKSLIARKYEAINQSFNNPDEKALRIISQVVSLDSAIKISDMQIDKVENDWHTSYINFNKLLGTLESTREELARVNGFALFFKKMLFNPVMFFIGIIIIIIAIFAGLQKTGLIDIIKEKLNIQTEESTSADDEFTDF